MKYLSELIKAIKQKPELKNINSDFIKPQLVDYIQKHPKIQKKIDSTESFGKFQLSKEYKLIIKQIRAGARKSYGMFQIDANKRSKLLNQLKQDPNNLTIINQLLETHRSTKERLPIYEELYKKIFKVTGKPKTILDLGCGLNPLSYPYMNLNNTTYIASELSEEDTNLIKDFFRIIKLKSKTIAIDLIKDYETLKNYKTDICFLFKLLDSLEVTQKNISQKLLNEINSKFIVVSFSTKTISGKPMRSIRRKWFENLCLKNNFKFELLEFENEIFYILSH